MRTISCASRWISPLLLGICSLLATGCSTCDQCHCRRPFWQYHDHCADIPPGAIPLPAGSYTQQWHAAQSEAAARDLFTIYGADWRAHTAKLGPFGERRLEQMMERLQACPNPVLIEKSDSPDLDEARRRTVIEALAVRGFTDAGQRVVVGYSEAYSLYGLEAKSVARPAFDREPSPNTTMAPSEAQAGGLRASLGGGYAQ